MPVGSSSTKPLVLTVHIMLEYHYWEQCRHLKVQYSVSKFPILAVFNNAANDPGGSSADICGILLPVWTAGCPLQGAWSVLLHDCEWEARRTREGGPGEADIREEDADTGTQNYSHQVRGSEGRQQVEQLLHLFRGVRRDMYGTRDSMLPPIS